MREIGRKERREGQVGIQGEDLIGELQLLDIGERVRAVPVRRVVGHRVGAVIVPRDRVIGAQALVDRRVAAIATIEDVVPLLPRRMLAALLPVIVSAPSPPIAFSITALAAIWKVELPGSRWLPPSD